MAEAIENEEYHQRNYPTKHVDKRINQQVSGIRTFLTSLNRRCHQSYLLTVRRHQSRQMPFLEDHAERLPHIQRFFQ